MSYHDSGDSVEAQLVAQDNNNSVMTSGPLGDNHVLNAVTSLLSRQSNFSKGDLLPFNAQLLVLTNSHKNTEEAKVLGSGQGDEYTDAENSDAFTPSLEQVHALATANLLASTQRDIAQQLAEASSNSDTQIQANKKQPSKSSPIKKRDAKSGGRVGSKRKSSPSDGDLLNLGSKALTCSFNHCKRKFASATHLKYHELTHTNNRQFECPDKNCGKTFYTAQRLKVHLRIHTGEKPFICSHEDCGKTFTTAGNLKNHGRIHTGEQPFLCDFDGCNRRFTEYSSLHKHKLTHSGDKPFECKICNKKFTQSGSRRQHLIRHHLDEEIRNSLAASRFKTESAWNAQKERDSITIKDTQHHVACRGKLIKPSMACSPRLMALGNALECVYEEALNGKPGELMALSQGSSYHGDEQERGVLYATDILDQEVNHTEYRISRDETPEEIVTPLEFHHHHHDNSIQSELSLLHSTSEPHHSNLYQNHHDHNEHEDMHLPNTGNDRSVVKGDNSSSYLIGEGELLHEDL